MTREEVIALAREAGFVVDEEAYARQPNCIFHTWHLIDEGLTRFAAFVAAAEREECARVCDEEQNDKWIGDEAWEVARRCAALIRARGNDDNAA